MQKDEEVGKVAQATPVVICAQLLPFIFLFFEYRFFVFPQLRLSSYSLVSSLSSQAR